MLCVRSFLVVFAAIATISGQIYGGPCYRRDKAALSDFRQFDSGTIRQKLISCDNKVRAVLSHYFTYENVTPHILNHDIDSSYPSIPHQA